MSPDSDDDLRIAPTRAKYARIPLELYRPELNSVDRDVYAAIAVNVWQGNTAMVNQGDIAAFLGIDRRTVQRSVARLKSAGAIKTLRVAGGVNAYELTSPVFGSKQGKVTEMVSLPNGHRRLTSVEKTG